MSDMTSRPPDFEIAPAADGGVANSSVAGGSSVSSGSGSASSVLREIAVPADRARRMDRPDGARPRMTAFEAIRAGATRSRRSARLVMLVWFVFLTLAWVAALPAWRWFDGVLSLAPEGDRLLSGLNIALLRELTHYDRSPTMSVAMGSAWTFFIFALILNPFVAGGTLGVLAASPTHGVTQRFVGEGMRFYWRFARILLLVAMLGGGVSLIVATGFEALGAAFDESGSALASMWADNLLLLSWLLVFGLSSLLLDAARILLLRRDDGRAAAAVKHALVFLWRNRGAVLVIGCTIVMLLAAVFIVYNLIASNVTPLSWGLLAFTILLQQLFALTRTAIRITLLASLTDLIDARDPRGIEPPADAAPLDEPVYELPMLG